MLSHANYNKVCENKYIYTSTKQATHYCERGAKKEEGMDNEIVHDCFVNDGCSTC